MAKRLLHYRPELYDKVTVRHKVAAHGALNKLCSHLFIVTLFLLVDSLVVLCPDEVHVAFQNTVVFQNFLHILPVRDLVDRFARQILSCRQHNVLALPALTDLIVV